MVATRNHPRDFEAPGTPTPESPTKRATRSAVASLSASLPDLSSATSTKASSPQNASKSRSSALHVAPPTRHKGSGWSHTPSQLTLIWLAISLPLVIWDTGYVLLRPYSMPGGFLHKPIWTPYGLYGTVDHVYGFPAWESKNGWTAAQGLFNAFETAVYLAYAYIVYAHGHRETVQGRGAPDKEKLGSFAALGESRTVYGKEAAVAVMLAYTTAWITFSKTVLYWLTEAFSGFHAIGHNDWTTLIFLWIIPNGAWLVLPLYMIYVYSLEIYEGLLTATDKRVKAS